MLDMGVDLLNRVNRRSWLLFFSKIELTAALLKKTELDGAHNSFLCLPHNTGLFFRIYIAFLKNLQGSFAACIGVFCGLYKDLLWNEYVSFANLWGSFAEYIGHIDSSLENSKVYDW